MNLPTFLISLALAAIVGLIIWKLVKDKRKGSSGCGSCHMSGSCHMCKEDERGRRPL